MYHRRTKQLAPYIFATLGLSASVSPVRANPWTGGISAFLFDPRTDDAFGLGIATADRNTLHLEARYNYEGLDTGSLFVGWNLALEGDVALALTPVLGLVVGETNGAAPGVEAELTWRALALYIEPEYVIDFENSDENFFYSWIEGTGSPLPWLRVGIAAQRNKSHETSLEMQRGPMIELS